MPSALDDIKMACAADGIKVLADVCGVILLTSVQAIVGSQTSDAKWVLALSEKDECMRRVTAVEA